MKYILIVLVVLSLLSVRAKALAMQDTVSTTGLEFSQLKPEDTAGKVAIKKSVFSAEQICL